MPQPTISIILPVKNGMPYIADCLQSIVNQSFIDWQLVVCNDNSTDGTAEVLADFAQKDKRILVCENAGNGVITALQMAYSLSKGALITRMDADDLMPENKLQILHDLWQKKGRGHVITGKVRYFPETEIAGGFKKYEQWLNALCDYGNHWDDLFKECVIPSPCWLLHRDDLEACGAFNPHIYPEDYDLVFRFYEKGLKVLASKEVLHLWRDHSTRASRTNDLYRDQNFFELKVNYFLKWKLAKNKQLVIWGASKKGKLLAKLFETKGQSFQWICNNPNKWNKHIGKVLMQAPNALLAIDNPCVILAVSSHTDRADIFNLLQQKSLDKNNGYFDFC